MIWLVAHVVIVGLCFAAILLRPNREPEARMAWLVVVFALPFGGAVAYLLLGSTSIGRKRLARLTRVAEALPAPVPDVADTQARGPYEALFRVGQSISGYAPVGGNSARLMADSDTMIDELVQDIDAAVEHVHLLFYIWLPDGNGTKVIEACKRAVGRGVTCRVMVDSLGSRDLARSKAWREMQAAGVRTAVALRIGNPLVRIFNGRIDLRNHRKIVVIDNRITYCGSQNCADPAFLPKARFGPWVDAVMRIRRTSGSAESAPLRQRLDGGGGRGPERACPCAGRGRSERICRSGRGDRTDGASGRDAGAIPVTHIRCSAGAVHHDTLLRP